MHIRDESGGKNMRAWVRIHHVRQVRSLDRTHTVQVHLESSRRLTACVRERVHYIQQDRQTEQRQFAYARTAINTERETPLRLLAGKLKRAKQFLSAGMNFLSCSSTHNSPPIIFHFHTSSPGEMRLGDDLS